MGGSGLSALTYDGSTRVGRRQAGTTDFTTNALGLGVADPGGSLISQRTPKATYYYVLDALGSVAALADLTGAAVGRYSYELMARPASRAR